MADTPTSNKSSRRSFLSRLLSQNRQQLLQQAGEDEKIRLLTPDGKLVEVERKVVEEASRKKKSTNREIYDWMNNPSKK